LARRARNEIFHVPSEEPFSDFRAQVSESLGWAPTQQFKEIALPENEVFAVLGYSTDGSVHLLSPMKSFQRTNFLIARSIFHLSATGANGSPTVLTPAHVYRQQIGRAFAAELLAPAEALAKRIRRPAVTTSEVSAMADQFMVAPQVIQHQIENHNLAEVEPT
jgi:hypothetical protein